MKKIVAALIGAGLPIGVLVALLLAVLAPLPVAAVLLVYYAQRQPKRR